MAGGARANAEDSARSWPLIGVFDSGVGGLSVVAALRRHAPDAPILYLADTAYAPYGLRERSDLLSRSAAIAALLAGEGADALVIACNTATAAAAETLRHRWGMPIIGMEPAVKPAAAVTRTGTLAVFATAGTLTSQRFAGLLEQHSRQTRVLVEPCGDLVDLAEAGEWTGRRLEQAVGRHLETVIAAGADTIVLGCTHFPLLRPVIEALAAGRVHIIDTGDAVARQVVARCQLPDTESPGGQATLRLLTTRDASQLTALAARLFPAATAARVVEVGAAEETADQHPNPPTP